MVINLNSMVKIFNFTIITIEIWFSLWEKKTKTKKKRKSAKKYKNFCPNHFWSKSLESNVKSLVHFHIVTMHDMTCFGADLCERRRCEGGADCWILVAKQPQVRDPVDCLACDWEELFRITEHLFAECCDFFGRICYWQVTDYFGTVGDPWWAQLTQQHFASVEELLATVYAICVEH